MAVFVRVVGLHVGLLYLDFFSPPARARVRLVSIALSHGSRILRHQPRLWLFGSTSSRVLSVRMSFLRLCRYIEVIHFFIL